MTDLENAGANVYYEIARKVVAASKNTSGEDVVDATTIIRTEMDAARAAGRIEGLEEAVSLVLGACPRCKGRGLDPSTSGIYGCTACFEPRQAIRARIQELEGEK